MSDEIEIDLRKIILKLMSAWKWIAAGALIAGLAGLAYALLSPTVFEAQSMVIVTNPRYIANFDPRYQTVDSSLLANKNYLDLANSDEILQTVLTQWNDPQKEKTKLDDFRKNIAKASYGSDSSIIKLSVTTKNPQESANLANFWANLFLKRANIIYSGNDPTQLDFFQKQLGEANQKYDAAKLALADFQKRNEIVPLTNTLNSLLASQMEALQKQRAIRNAQEDARALLKQLDGVPTSSKITSTDKLNWTILRANFYAAGLTINTANMSSASMSSANNPNTGSSPSVSASPSIQLQLPTSNSNDDITASDQMRDIQSWITSLDQQLQSIQASLQGLNSQITSLQGQIQTLQNEQKFLTQQRDIASETFETLSRKTEEVRISIQQQTGDIRVAANAIVPTESVSNHVGTTTALGMVGGALVVSVILMFLDWWKSLAKQEGTSQH